MAQLPCVKALSLYVFRASFRLHPLMPASFIRYVRTSLQPSMRFFLQSAPVQIRRPLHFECQDRAVDLPLACVSGPPSLLHLSHLFPPHAFSFFFLRSDPISSPPPGIAVGWLRDTTSMICIFKLRNSIERLSS